MRTPWLRYTLGIAIALFALCPVTVNAQTYTLGETFGSFGSSTGQFNTPSFVTLDSNNNILVDDFLNNRVQVFTHDGTYIRTITGGLVKPLGVVTDSSGNTYVSNYGNSSVDEFDSSGNFLRTLASGVNLPYGLVIDQAGNIYVAENHAFVEEFDTTGALVQTFGTFSDASGITLDVTGNLYVANSFNDTIDELNSSGGFVRSFGSAGSGNGELNSPEGVAVDASGNVYAADYSNNRIVEFNNAGVFVQNIGVGTLSTPYDDSFDSSGNLFVADRGNNRIVEFDLAAGSTPEPSALAAFGIGATLLVLRRKVRK